jgi:hypothetical protein
MNRKLEWVKDDRDLCPHYNSWCASTPFGPIVISWKGWKDHPYAVVDEFPGTAFWIPGNPDDVRDRAEELFWQKVDELAHPPKPEPAREPMTPKERSDSYIELEETIGPDAHLMSFLSGIAAAERYHKILGGSDE